ncbi:MAG TPA: stage V sporulation protein AE [Candidatus Aphodomonas merdavium]|nr:stage V sporulation protein AE [Candidatus Aphodomonas merdavium]
MWSLLWSLLKAFVVGGILCAAGEALLLKTRLTSARILVGYVTAGVVLGAIGLWQPLADWAGAGATVPLLGFGNSLAQGALKAVQNRGLLGAFTGGVESTAAGITAAVFFGYLMAILFRPKMKSE